MLLCQRCVCTTKTVCIRLKNKIQLCPVLPKKINRFRSFLVRPVSLIHVKGDHSNPPRFQIEWCFSKKSSNVPRPHPQITLRSRRVQVGLFQTTSRGWSDASTAIYSYISQDVFEVSKLYKYLKTLNSLQNTADFHLNIDRPFQNNSPEEHCVISWSSIAW